MYNENNLEPINALDLIPTELWAIVGSFLKTPQDFINFAKTCSTFFFLVAEKFNFLESHRVNKTPLGRSDFYLTTCYLNSLYFNVINTNPEKIRIREAEEIQKNDISLKTAIKRKAVELCAQFFSKNTIEDMLSQEQYFIKVKSQVQFFEYSSSIFSPTFNRLKNKLAKLEKLLQKLQTITQHDTSLHSKIIIHVIACMLLSLYCQYQINYLHTAIERLLPLIIKDAVFFYLNCETRYGAYFVYLMPSILDAEQIIPLNPRRVPEHTSYHANCITEDLLENKPLNYSLQRTSLCGVNLANKNLSQHNFSHADLSRAILSNAQLHKVNFENANLKHANLQHAKLDDSQLKNANFDKANLVGVDLSKVNIENTAMNKAYRQFNN